jgi:murein DD-endopeptidase MepM/ murein hydrolase activator NlpD
MAAALLALGLGLAMAGATVEPAPLVLERDGRGGAAARVRNTLAGPLQVTLSGDSDGGDRLPVTRVLAAGESRVLAHTGAQPRLQLGVVPGQPMLLPPPTPRLQWPLPADGPFRISQTFGGASSHRSPDNWHAVDIAVAEGTPVLAAQAGRVMEVVDHFRGAGTTADWKDRANRVRVLAADGCMLLYAHLQPGSAVVQPGQTVAAGQPLARSGHTGWSTAPHLHLGRQCNVGGELLSAPFHLNTPRGSADLQPEG